MEKTKGQKIAYSAATIILAVILGIILLNRFGIIDINQAVNKTVNSDYYFQSEPFGELNAVWCLESSDEKLGDDYYIKESLKSSDNFSEYQVGRNYYVSEVKNINYDMVNHIYSLYDYNEISYVAFFVPMSCEFAQVNGGEKFEAKSGEINTPSGSVEFKYVTVTYRSLNLDSDEYQPDTLILYDYDDNKYEYKDDFDN